MNVQSWRRAQVCAFLLLGQVTSSKAEFREWTSLNKSRRRTQVKDGETWKPNRKRGGERGWAAERSWTKNKSRHVKPKLREADTRQTRRLKMKHEIKREPNEASERFSREQAYSVKCKGEFLTNAGSKWCRKAEHFLYSKMKKITSLLNFSCISRAKRFHSKRRRWITLSHNNGERFRFPPDAHYLVRRDFPAFSGRGW